MFSVDTVTELGLATDTPRTRLQWKTESGPSKLSYCLFHLYQSEHFSTVINFCLAIAGVPLKNVPVKAPDFTVVLQPMQIRTFQVTAKI